MNQVGNPDSGNAGSNITHMCVARHVFGPLSNIRVSFVNLASKFSG